MNLKPNLINKRAREIHGSRFKKQVMDALEVSNRTMSDILSNPYDRITLRQTRRLADCLELDLQSTVNLLKKQSNQYTQTYANFYKSSES